MTRVGGRLTSSVDLRGLKRGRYTVKIVAADLPRADDPGQPPLPDLREGPKDRQGRPDLSRGARRPLAREVVRRWPELAEDAEELIASGVVLVDGLRATNPRTLVAADASVRVASGEPGLRGRVKLSAALAGFGVDARDAVALDAGRLGRRVRAGAARGGRAARLRGRGRLRPAPRLAGAGRPRRVARAHERRRADARARPRPARPRLARRRLPAAGQGRPAARGGDASPPARSSSASSSRRTSSGSGRCPRTPTRRSSEAVAQASAGIEAAGWRVVATMRSPVSGSRGAVEAFVHAQRGR